MKLFLYSLYHLLFVEQFVLKHMPDLFTMRVFSGPFLCPQSNYVFCKTLRASLNGTSCDQESRNKVCYIHDLFMSVFALGLIRNLH